MQLSIYLGAKFTPRKKEVLLQKWKQSKTTELIFWGRVKNPKQIKTQIFFLQSWLSSSLGPRINVERLPSEILAENQKRVQNIPQGRQHPEQLGESVDKTADASWTALYLSAQIPTAVL